MDDMKKENLIKRAEKYCEFAKTKSLMHYPRNSQEEIAKLSTAIIKTICESENTTPFIAIQSLNMAMDMINKEMQFDTIS